MGEIVFYTNPMSRGRIVRWMLEETGLPYRTEIVEYPEMKTAAYLAVNPMGKVPALVHDGSVVTEAAAICAYLAELVPERWLAPPPGDPLRGAYYRWLFFGAGPIEAVVSLKALKVEPTQEQTRMIGCGGLGDVESTLEAAIGQRSYLVGERFTAADLYVGCQLAYGMMFNLIEKRPVFERYCAGLRQRPAFVQAQALDGAAD